jgi:hypothetical protein
VALQERPQWVSKPWRALSSKVSSIINTLIDRISCAAAQVKTPSLYTAPFGNTIAAQFLLGTTSTTNSRTTTILPTSSASNASLDSTTSHCMALSNGRRRTERSGWLIWLRSVLLRLRGTRQKKDWIFTERMDGKSGSNSLPISDLATSAATASRLRLLDIRTDSAQMPASRHGDARPDWTTRRADAPNVGPILPATNTPARSAAQGRVLDVREAGFSAPVYDLEIEGEHEFYASGILVHNCRYALSDMIMKRGGLSVWERLVRPTR